MKELTLVYSFIGMEKKAVRWKGEKELNITLVTEVAEMDEVVVTGIFTRKKESFTGSSATFTNKELKMIGNSNVLESLKTLDPSFAIIENNDFGSDPNHLPNIEIRGKTSVIGLTEEYNTDPNQPLFILDGFESTLATISDLSMDRVLFHFRKDVRIQKPPKSFLRFSGGWFYAPVFLTPMHKRYSISMRLGFAGRAFCCCGAGSTMCRMPSSNFAWMSSFFTASPT